MENYSASENEPLILSDSSNLYECSRNICRPQKYARDSRSLEVAAVFVVAFDTTKGNVVEWCKPDFMKQQLAGLEFKAMPSGAHTLDDDYVYLYEADLYGVACYQKISVDSDEERGARMKSVGVLCQSYLTLEPHKKCLQELVKSLLTNPGDYSLLNDYYSQWTGDIQAKNSLLLSNLNLSYPGTYFEDVMKTLGPKLFTIWKAMILQKRVLIYSQPPAHSICQQVYCCTYMMSEAARLRTDMCTPFFYVNIADCDTLSMQVSYIACTTEKVFELKTDMYDVYIDMTNIRIANPRLRKILAATSGDKVQLNRLWGTLRRPISVEDDQPMTVEDNFYSYFINLNRSIAEKVQEFESNDQTSLSRHDIESMGLDTSDSAFINELLDNLNLEMNTACALCRCC